MVILQLRLLSVKSKTTSATSRAAMNDLVLTFMF